MTVWWLFQFLYAGAVILWMAGAALMVREFFREYHGSMYDTAGMNHHAGIPGRGPLTVAESPGYRAWKEGRAIRLRRALTLFLAGIVLHTALHLTQVYVLPRFEIPFWSNPVPEQAVSPEETPSAR